MCGLHPWSDRRWSRSYSASQIRDAILSQDVELVLTAHPTEAQRRTILKKHKRIVELLGEHDKRDVLTPGEVVDIKNSIRSEQVHRLRPRTSHDAHVTHTQVHAHEPPARQP